MAISGVGQSYYQTIVATTKSTKRRETARGRNLGNTKYK